jgi:LytS/YehU family sensor histidine kinase
VPVFLLAAFGAALSHLLPAMLPGFCGAGDWVFAGFVSPSVFGVIRATILYSLWSLVFVVGSLAVERGETRRRTESLQQDVRDAAVRLLLDQLDPHFLSNVLMLVQAEADDPSRVRELVLRISQYLRTAIGRASPMLPVGQQAEECLAYLQLQRARFGQSLSWRIEVEPEAAGLLLPRLTVQTLVEHAVLDGFEVSGEATEILVAARLKGEQLLLEVVHPCSQERLSSDASTEPEKQSQWLQDLCRRL